VKEAVLEPKWTAVAPVKFVPVTFTGVPPSVDPPVGATPLTVGGDGGGVEFRLIPAPKDAAWAAMRPAVAKAKIAVIGLPTRTPSRSAGWRRNLQAARHQHPQPTSPTSNAASTSFLVRHDGDDDDRPGVWVVLFLATFMAAFHCGRKVKITRTARIMIKPLSSSSST
jgi:hypothetical protein